MTAASGHDGNGTEYSTIDELWDEHSTDVSSTWYSKAMEYWSSQDASINGVLGGFGDLHPIDMTGTDMFFNQVERVNGPFRPSAVIADCGAGVGRISQFLLSRRFPKSRIDMIEPCEKLIEQAKLDLVKTMKTEQIGSFVNLPLQQWRPNESHYDVLWHQWVLLYLTDSDCVDYLVRCRKSLTLNGLICVKENVALKGQFLVDTDDNSVTRTLDQYKQLFQAAGLRIVTQVQQPRWPSHLFPVLMWALAPL
jgi:protein N-terminal methyltransferase